MTELEEAGIMVLGGGTTHTSTMSKRASVATRKGQAVRPTSTVLWWLYVTRTCRQIRSRSTVSELWEGLYGDVDGSLDGPIDQQRQQGVRLGRNEGRNIRRSPVLGKCTPFANRNSMSEYQEVELRCLPCLLEQPKYPYASEMRK